MNKRKIYASHLISLIFMLIGVPLLSQSIPKETPFKERAASPFYAFKKIGNTSVFQGNKKKKNYFEGWYFKMVSADGTSILSVIPGISLSKDGKEQHAFIQIINGITAQSTYHTFPIESFSYSRKNFSIKIADNYFSKDSLILSIQDNETKISGKVIMSNQVDYESNRLLNPGIMGWYRFVPFMECYHGVVSLTHALHGHIRINQKVYYFEGGKGYIEKDWGSSMPSAWIWMQSNHFNDENTSFMLSIADIPWLKKSFTGFLGFFYHDEKVYNFATYRPTKLLLEITDTNEIQITIKNKRNTFLIRASTNNAGILKAPVNGSMDRRIPESIDSNLQITMLDKKGNLLFQDSTHIAGLEMVGDFKKLQGYLK